MIACDFSNLARDMVQNVCSLLDPEDILNASKVCKKWNDAAKADNFWKKYCCIRWDCSELFGTDWKTTAQHFFRWEKGICTEENHKNPTVDNRETACLVNYRNNRSYELRHKSSETAATLVHWSSHESVSKALSLPSSEFRLCAFHSDYLIVGTKESKIIVYQCDTGEVFKKIDDAHNGNRITSLIYFDGKLVSTSIGDELKIWDLNTKTVIKTIQTGISRIKKLAKLTDDRILIFSTIPRGIFVLNLEDEISYKLINSLSIIGYHHIPRHSVYKNKIAVISPAEPTLYVWDLDKHSDTAVFEINLSDSLPSTSYPSDNYLCAIAEHILITSNRFSDNQSTIRGWDIKKGTCLFKKTFNGVAQELFLDRDKLIVWSRRNIQIFNFSILPLSSEAN